MFWFVQPLQFLQVMFSPSKTFYQHRHCISWQENDWGRGGGVAEGQQWRQWCQSKKRSGPDYVRPGADSKVCRSVGTIPIDNPPKHFFLPKVGHRTVVVNLWHECQSGHAGPSLLAPKPTSGLPIWEPIQHLYTLKPTSEPLQTTQERYISWFSYLVWALRSKIVHHYWHSLHKLFTLGRSQDHGLQCGPIDFSEIKSAQHCSKMVHALFLCNM